jgi:glucose/arabinose dehydrogenase
MVDFAMIPGSNDEAIVLLKDAQEIWRVSLTSAFSPTLYGDLDSYVTGPSGEEGLLSAAFSPNFASDGRIYVYYTQGGDSGQPTVLSRFQVSGNAMVTAAPGAETRILLIPDFAGNHNGGTILFGQDGLLYLSLGDGGGGGDPQEMGQNIDSLLGKVLRINVTGVTTPPYYTIPGDNPFVAGPGRDEIFAYGFRNPWRMGKDTLTGTIWVGDVGQADWEEVEPVVKGGNYGWDCYEGFAQFETTGCAPSGYTFPRAVYDHGGGCAVIGGHVYRGSAMPEINGWYVYGDGCSGRIWAVDATPGATSPPVQLLDSPHNIWSFAERPDHELFVVTANNAIYMIHSDGDGDGLAANQDNCPALSNAGGQGDDADGDLAGDACDAPGSGNANCDNAVNSVDALLLLRHSSALGINQNDPCRDIGVQVPMSGELMGDVNCSNAINSVDALLVLRAAASLPVNIPGGCPVIKP